VKYLKTYEGVRDLMKPKSEENTIELIEPTIIKFLDKSKKYVIKQKLDDSWDLGLASIMSLQTHYSNHYILNYFFDDDHKPTPIIDKIITNWLNINFPEWTEEDYYYFWDGFEYDDIY
jgi:hypothetical protein